MLTLTIVLATLASMAVAATVANANLRSEERAAVHAAVHVFLVGGYWTARTYYPMLWVDVDDSAEYRVWLYEHRSEPDR